MLPSKIPKLPHRTAGGRVSWYLETSLPSWLPPRNGSPSLTLLSLLLSFIFCPAAAAAKSLQSCPTLCDPIDGSPPGSPIPGILQARTLECFAISFSNILPCLLLKRMGYLSECLVSSVSVQKLFCGTCSAFKWSFDELVGEKVVSPSYSSAILGPPLAYVLLKRRNLDTDTGRIPCEDGGLSNASNKPRNASDYQQTIINQEEARKDFPTGFIGSIALMIP